MRGLTAGILLLFLFSGCRNRLGIVGRTAADYLRLEPGNRWVMASASGDTVIFSLTPIEAAEDSLLLWELGPLAFEIAVEPDGVYRHLQTLAYRGGDPVLLEDRLSLLLPVPFVTGATWRDTWSNSEVFMSDTFYITRRFHGRVEGLLSLTVPAGTFQEVYRVRLIDSLRVQGPSRADETSRDLRLYFAPQVGVVRVETAEGDTFSLVRTEF